MLQAWMRDRVVCIIGRHYLAVTQQIAILVDIIIRHIFRISASEKPLLLRMEKRALPTMMQTMKHEKTIPRGVLPVSRTGVQRNTKMYMQDSRRDWQDPRRRTCLSLKMILSPSIQLPLKLFFLSPKFSCQVLMTRTPQTTSGSRATTKGATGP